MWAEGDEIDQVAFKEDSQVGVALADREWSCGHSNRCGCLSGDAAPATRPNASSSCARRPPAALQNAPSGQKRLPPIQTRTSERITFQGEGETFASQAGLFNAIY